MAKHKQLCRVKLTDSAFHGSISITEIYNLAINRQINQERFYMPKNEAKVKDVLDASKEILSQNSGKMSYQAWQDALTAKLGSYESALKHIVKNKLVIFGLEGFDEDMRPIMVVVSDKANLTATKPIVEPKKGGK
jgi:hypothetical protein